MSTEPPKDLPYPVTEGDRALAATAWDIGRFSTKEVGIGRIAHLIAGYVAAERAQRERKVSELERDLDASEAARRLQDKTYAVLAQAHAGVKQRLAQFQSST